jgi:hypothetical protein
MIALKPGQGIGDGIDACGQIDPIIPRPAMLGDCGINTAAVITRISFCIVLRHAGDFSPSNLTNR